MSRKPRIHLPGGYYHVMMRGNCGHDIFFSPSDRTRFLLLLQEGIERYGHRVHAFCLMDNHVHLLIQVGSIPLSRIIQNLSFRYTKHINRQRKEVGHLFQGRYKAILVDADSYLLELARYIHLNPVRAGICETAEAFEWSSYHAYVGETSIPWLYTQEILSLFSHHEHQAKRRFVEFVIQGVNEGQRLEFHHGSHLGQILGDDSFAEQALLASESGLLKPIKLDDVLEAVCREYKIDDSLLYQKGNNRSNSEARAMAALVIQDIEGITLASLAEKLSRDLSTLSQSAGRLRKRMQDNPSILRRFDEVIGRVKHP
jgi:REP element-mobilizing transposase RayT